MKEEDLEVTLKSTRFEILQFLKSFLFDESAQSRTISGENAVATIVLRLGADVLLFVSEGSVK